MKTFGTTVVECGSEEKGSDTILLKLKLDNEEKFSAEAGQFIVLSPRSDSSVMPRPFTVVDVEGATVSILFRAVGKNTEIYSQLKVGDKIKIIGPQGTRINFSPKNKKCIFVGGGIGGAALVMPVKKALAEGKKVLVLLGAKNEKQLAGMSFFVKMGVDVKVVLESDQGELVTAILKEALEKDKRFSEVIACGPRAMLYKVFSLCERYVNKCQVIVEEIMACGMGACKGCAIFGREFGEEVKHVCSDGPTFDAKWINWERFIGMNMIYLMALDHAPKKEIGKKTEINKIDLSCQLGPLFLKTPFLNCSGTLDIGACEDGSVDIGKLGAFVTKGLSLNERNGNPMPRICETPSGMLNSIGLEYIGIKRFFKEILPRVLEFNIPMVVNINGNSEEEYAELATKLKKSGVSALEVNISCPNVKSGGMLFGKDPKMAARIVEKVCFFSDLPVIAKLTPNVTNIQTIARAVEKAGADIISIINTISASAINIWTRKPKIANISAGLSGPAIRPVAVWNVMQVFQAVEIPIIGMGGNENGYTAAEFMMAGATATAFGTSIFADRDIFAKAVKELAEVARFHGLSRSQQLVDYYKKR